jgi:hypothetical protein
LALLEPGFVLEHFNTAGQNQQASLSFLVCGYMDPDPAFLSEYGTRILMTTFSFLIKIAIYRYLSLGLHKGRPTTSKDEIY